MVLNPDLLAVLACPACKGGLERTDEAQGLICRKCAVVYPVVEEIPIMLAEEAIPLRQWERNCPAPWAGTAGPRNIA